MYMVSFLAATAALCAIAPVQIAQPGPNLTPSLTVTGNSEVKVAPDMATVTIGVVAQSKSAQSAQNDANTRAQAFIDKVKKLLGTHGKVHTGSINLYPVYSEAPPRSDQVFTPQITGYRADNTLTVETDDLKLVGPVIDTAVASGLNNVQGVSFGLKDDSAAKLKALAQAVQEARAKAEAMANAADVTLAGIWDLNEGGARVIPMEAPMARMSMSAAATPVEPGNVSVSADVTIRFFIRPKR
jgi:uncharacterized protein